MGAIKNLIIWLLSVILAFIGGIFTMWVLFKQALNETCERKYQREEERV